MSPASPQSSATPHSPSSGIPAPNATARSAGLDAATPAVRAPRRAADWAATRRRWVPDFVAKIVFGRPLPPDREEWQRVLAALRQGDAPMDAVVDWMFAAGPRQAKALFEQALTRGIDTIDNPPAPLADFFRLIDNPPPWLDRALVEEGALAAQTSGYVGFYVLRDMALMGGYAYFSSFNQVLAATGSLHRDVALRLGETGKWLNDVTATGGLERFGEGFLTTIRVRMVHALVRRHLRGHGNGNSEWDEDTWGVPINQIDMLATYLAFGPVTLVGVRAFGVPVTPRDSRAAMHMWRYIGWLSGVREEWLALTERDGLRKLYHTFLTHRLPDEKIGLLGSALRDQPLTQQLPELDGHLRLAWLKRRYLYQKHISNSALIMLPRQRRQLGIPFYALPWYPLATAPFRFIQLGYYRLRGGEVLAGFSRRSREKQYRLLQSYFAGRDVDIIRPDATHPASIERG